ncbi:hypothetical protein Taro_030868 [Colocasia esculenta]|uniref:Xyloglucan endotransglucosylase/hydrolase n=1 Tax=Colocasia esculenta TaxID=4460 RepID=A0A843VQ98_COLES|nr:hypothetical protein [Colocasia esculenta]
MGPPHGGFLLGCLLLYLALQPLPASAVPVNFSQNFQPYWAPDHISTSLDGGPLRLTLDNTSGCGFASRKTYLFGQVSVQIKLVEGDSAGTVTAFYVSSVFFFCSGGQGVCRRAAALIKKFHYMSSAGDNHDELDLEFLGNVSGEPYLLQTNVYVNGTGNREQRHSLWFDPTTDFHSYAVFWNRYHIRILVDGIPIRVFENKEAGGVPYPKQQPMGIYGSVWNADDWATQGGRVKTNWTHAPFVTAFRSFDIDACEAAAAAAPGAVDDGAAAGYCGGGDDGGGRRQAWWDAPGMAGLSPHQRRQLKWARAKHLVYDYCRDAARFAQGMPGECLG